MITEVAVLTNFSRKTSLENVLSMLALVGKGDQEIHKEQWYTGRSTKKKKKYHPKVKEALEETLPNKTSRISKKIKTSALHQNRKIIQCF